MSIQLGNTEAVVNHDESRSDEVAGAWPDQRERGDEEVETACRGHSSKKYGSDESHLKNFVFLHIVKEQSSKVLVIL